MLQPVTLMPKFELTVIPVKLRRHMMRAQTDI